MLDSKTLWTEVSGHLLSIISIHEFNTWFGRCLMQVSGNTATLLVPNHLFLNWIKERYRSMLEQALLLASGQPMLLALAIMGETEHVPLRRIAVNPQSAVSAKIYQPRYGNINQKYNFNSFLIGPGNELAYAACMAVATQPGRQYNPLFIYGEAGLGKTHLLCAVGNAVLQNNPDAKVHYCSAEIFTNELIEAIRLDCISLFQEKYRTIDCLLLDDIQFLGSQERIQEEFFHTFNSLYYAGKQIVVTSDNMPKKIIYLEKRISSLLEWGLLADLQPPDESLKIAILHHKASERGVELNINVAHFLVNLSDNNIRSLEGYLTKLIAVCEIQGKEITMELATNIISSMTTDHKVKVEDIISIIAAYFGVTIEDIKSGRKNREISYPRLVAMYLSRRLTKISFSELGKSLGNKDHSTVVKGFKKIEYLIKSNYEIREQVRRLEQFVVDEKNKKYINITDK